jgi:hypothetical protein
VHVAVVIDLRWRFAFKLRIFSIERSVSNVALEELGNILFLPQLCLLYALRLTIPIHVNQVDILVLSSASCLHLILVLCGG